MIAAKVAGGEYQSRGEAWQAAAPLLAELLAEAALRAVDAGDLVTVRVDGRQVIMTMGEAAGRGVAAGARPAGGGVRCRG